MHRSLTSKNTSIRPLNSQRICDIGCGGGIVAEALSRLGAIVTGIDPSQESIAVAKGDIVTTFLSLYYINF